MSSEKALFCELDKAEDVESDSPLARKHVPVITVPQVLKAGEFYDVKIKD
jgi:superoxide reductase